MIDSSDLQKIKEVTGDFLQNMTITDVIIEVDLTAPEHQATNQNIIDVVSVDIQLQEPQVLIGQNGQTLFDVQRLLKMIINKKLGKIMYVELDINNYKSKKVEYLKNLARTSADQVALTRQKEVLSPMPSYERRLIHAELSGRTDVTTQSQGEGESRHIVVSPQ